MSSIEIPDLSFLNKQSYISRNNRKNNNYNYVSVLGMLTAFFAILLIFLIIAINNIWIFIGFFTLSSLIVMWNSISNKKSMVPVVVLIIVGSFITIWQYHDNF